MELKNACIRHKIKSNKIKHNFRHSILNYSLIVEMQKFRFYFQPA